MLITNKGEAISAQSETNAVSRTGNTANATQSRLSKMLRFDWLGQTVASICWIASVLTMGINSLSDWLQLFAALSWLIANIAAVVNVKKN